MKRKARKLYTKCRRKIRYPTYREAKTALRRMLAGPAAGDKALEIYFCHYCKGHHLGHP